jgi:ParB family chromosome partitioning protein
MDLVQLSLERIIESSWNPNQMDDATHIRLKRSIQRFGLVVPLVVRLANDGNYETLGGAQRLSVLRELGIDSAPCVIVETDDANARLLAQALNRIQGQDDLGLKAELLKEVLEKFSQEEVLVLLPETTLSLQGFAALGQQDMAAYLQNWQQAQSARLKHLTFQSTPCQLEVIEEALARVMPQVKTDPTNPNPRGNALYLLCKCYLDLTWELP